MLKILDSQLHSPSVPRFELFCTCLPSGALVLTNFDRCSSCGKHMAAWEYTNQTVSGPEGPQTEVEVRSAVQFVEN